MIFVSNSCGRHIKQLKNGLPVKEFRGGKKDHTLVALYRYLQGFVRVKDVREKIQHDFKAPDV